MSNAQLQYQTINYIKQLMLINGLTLEDIQSAIPSRKKAVGLKKLAGAWKHLRQIDALEFQDSMRNELNTTRYEEHYI